jgi:DNA polymerase (family 10)
MAVAATPTENIDIAKIFEDVADLLEMQGANQFRVRAYRTAARTVETLSVPCASLAKTDPKALQKFPGIAKDLAGKICEIVDTGSLALLRELTAQLPESLVEMMRLPGLGPKRAKQIYDTSASRRSRSWKRPRSRGGCASSAASAPHSNSTSCA